MKENRNTMELNPEKITFIFDVDGTLTPPNKPMDIQFMRWFERWMTKPNINIVLCTNSTYESIVERLGRRIIEQASAVFTCGGNELWMQHKKKILNTWKPNPDLVQFLDQILKDNNFKIRSGPNIEYRTGLLSFSVSGKNASLEERDKYKKFDYETKDRLKIVKLLKEKFPNLNIMRTGETSIDICNEGCDKSQILKYFSDEKRLWVIGNEFDNFGNDKPFKEALDKNKHISYNIKSVVSDVDTFSFLRKITV